MTILKPITIFVVAVLLVSDLVKAAGGFGGCPSYESNQVAADFN